MLTDIIKKFSDLNILVIGDLILDKFVYGDVERINPEAPVPVLKVQRDDYKPGGAANVAANIRSLGGKCTVVGQIGDDYAGRKLCSLLDDAGIKSHLIERDDFMTMVKTRIVARNQQVIRVDREEPRPLSADHTRDIVRFVGNNKYDMIVVSDYAKGVVNAELMTCLRDLQTRTIVDPKPSNMDLYKGLFLLTPNLKESMEICADDDIDSRGRRIGELLDSNVVITRGADGASLFTTDGGQHYVPSRRREVYDVVGAGDTFVAAIALATAAGFDLIESCSLANAASGIAVEKVGTSTITVNELMSSLEDKNSKLKDLGELKGIVKGLKNKGNRIVFTNGCFDILHVGHTKLLKEAKSHGDVLVLGLNSDESIRTLKGEGRPINDENDRAEVLSHLPYVDYIVFFNDSTPCKLIGDLKPDVHVKGGDYDPNDYSRMPEAEVVKSYGGRIAMVKYVDGKSSTKSLNMLKKIELLD